MTEGGRLLEWGVEKEDKAYQLQPQKNYSDKAI